MQIKDILFETLTWKDGSFTFVDISPLTDETLSLRKILMRLFCRAWFFFDDVSFELSGE